MTCTNTERNFTKCKIWKNYSELTIRYSAQHVAGKLAAGREKSGRKEQRKSFPAQQWQRKTRAAVSLYTLLAVQKSPNGSVWKDLGEVEGIKDKAMVCLALDTTTNKENNLSLAPTGLIVTCHHPFPWTAVCAAIGHTSRGNCLIQIHPPLFFFFGPVFNWINSPLVHT